jgi:hypothetical protein
MRRVWPVVPLLLICLACGGAEEPAGHGDEHDEEVHDHEAKHGGETMVLGEEEAHLEVLVNHGEGFIRVWSYDAEMNVVPLDGPPVLNLKYADGLTRLTAELVPDGEDAPCWEFRDEKLKEEPESGRFQIALGGRSYSPDLEHDHEDH